MRIGGSDMSRDKKLTDVHAHMEQYTSEELESVLSNADEAGIRWILTSGFDLQTSLQGMEIAASHEQVLASIGIHPWTAAENFPIDFDEKFPELVKKKAAVAVGEVGLDFVDNVFSGTVYRDNQELCRLQENALRKQVALAAEAGLPLIVHCRGAYRRMMSILEEEKANRVGGVIHNFDESKTTAGRLLDMGFFVSFGGALTYPEATELRDTVRHVPLDGILIETDSPYMPLYLQRPEKNEPANVARVARTLAEIKKMEVEGLIDRTYKNFTELLHIED
jgi:TatD DNase family protein